MKWAICYPNGPWDWFYWDGSNFQHDPEKAAQFYSEELAQKVIYRVWDEEPEDADECEFMAKICVRQI